MTGQGDGFPGCSDGDGLESTAALIVHPKLSTLVCACRYEVERWRSGRNKDTFIPTIAVRRTDIFSKRSPDVNVRIMLEDIEDRSSNLHDCRRQNPTCLFSLQLCFPIQRFPTSSN
jgi:hypothetical protein